jgi:large subunit ribosomal protein L21
MYAVVRSGGKQYRVQEGSELVVEKIDAGVGESVDFDVLFFSDGKGVVADPSAASTASVTAEVVEQFKGDKVVVFKFKRRKGYKRNKGHRQELTRVKVTGIAAPTAKPKKKAAKKAKPAEDEVTEAGKAEPKEPESEEVKTEEAPAETVEAREVSAESVEVEEKAEEVAVQPAAEEAAVEVSVEEETTEPEEAAEADADAEPERCTAITGSGTRCKNKAKEGSQYCGVHAKKYEG